MFPLYDNNPTQRTPVVTYALVAINVLVFFWMSRLPDVQRQLLAYEHGFVPKRLTELSEHQPVVVPIEVTVQTFWGPQRQQGTIQLTRARADLVVACDLHVPARQLDARIAEHVVLWLFGDNVEDRLGPLLYLVLYVLGGLIASGTHWAVAPESTMPVIGAAAPSPPCWGHTRSPGRGGG